MTRILVVDDEADLEVLIRQKFRKKIKADEYNFFFAANGVEALKQLENIEDVDIVLSDINMPEMDGLTLLSKISETNNILKSVIISAYGDMDNIRTAMNRGAFDFITKPVDFNDLEITIEKTRKHVEQLKGTLKALKENNIMKLYVDESVLNFMGSQEFESAITKNELIDGTVAFIDICKFTSISEQVNPDTLVEMLNHYFDIMVKEILEHGGFIDKFIGDAVMCVFRNEDHLKRAVTCAISVREKMKESSGDFSKVNFKPELSIGINSGEMISGNIGSTSLRRLDYTVLGDVVNIASRLQSAAENGQILITAECYENVKNDFNCKDLGEQVLKNKEQPMNLYEVMS